MSSLEYCVLSNPVFMFKASVLGAAWSVPHMYAEAESEDVPLGVSDQPLPRAAIIWVDDLVSPLIKAMGVNGAQWTSVCSSTDL